MPDTYEHEHAVMEAQRNESADAWDRGAPMDDAERRLYENGFTSGWVRRGALYPGAHPSASAATERQLPAEMDDELRDILGTACFRAIHFAQAARSAGHQIDTKAEAEQAAFIWWKLGHYRKHGAAGWRAAAFADLEAMKVQALGVDSTQEGGAPHG